jgi:hypothetical protein
MNIIKQGSLRKKMLALMSVLTVVGSLGFLSTSIVLADSDEVVGVKGINYEVRHNGNGPYITINGVKYYLQDDRVTVNGITYSANGEGDRHESDRHEKDRHDRDRNDRHHESDRHRHHHKD